MRMPVPRRRSVLARPLLLAVLGLLAFQVHVPGRASPAASSTLGPAGVVLPGSRDQDASLLPIAEQEALLLDAIQKTLPDVAAKYGTAAAAGVRALCVGSWCVPGRARTRSDLDLTIGHKNPEIAKFVTDRVNTIVARTASDRGVTHHIKAIVDGDPDFAELFKGPTGETFVYRYAKMQSLGEEATLRWTRNANGTWTREWAHVDEYWKGLGRQVPTAIVEPGAFARQAAKLMGQAVREAADVTHAAEKVAKYMGFVENIIKPAMVEQWGKPLPPDAILPPRVDRQMQVLLELKQAGAELSEAERTARLLEAFGVQSESELDSALKSFVDQGEGYFAKTSRELDVFEELSRTGRLGEIDDLSRAARSMNVIYATLGPITHGLLNAGDVALILYALHTGDHLGAAAQTAMTLLGYGVPQAAIGVVVSQLALDLGVKLPVEALVFDPINQMATAGVFDPANEWYIFGWPLSPFRNTTAATLACRIEAAWPDPAAHQLKPLVNAYVADLTAWRGLSGAARFSAAGAGAIQTQLEAILLDLWKASRANLDSAMQLEYNLVAHATTRRPAERPLALWVDRTPVGNRQHRTIAKTVAAGDTAVFTIDLLREYGVATGRAITTESVAGKWCELGGTTRAFRDWLDAASPVTTTYEPGTSPLQVGVSMSGPSGWTIRGGGDIGLVRAASASGLQTAERKVALPSGGQWARQRRFTIEVAPGATTAGAVSATVGLRLTDDFGGPPQTMAVTLVVNPIPTVEPPRRVDEPAPPDAGAECLQKARQPVEAAQKDFERWRDNSRGKTWAPFVCGPDPWFPCLKDPYARVWVALDGALPVDQWGYNRVPQCAGAFLKSNTGYNECVWGVYLEKVKTLSNQEAARCGTDQSAERRMR